MKVLKTKPQNFLQLLFDCTFPAHLLHEEVVHAAVVVSGGEDVQRVVLPLGGLQGDAADLHAAPPPHLGRRLLVLLAVPDAARRRRLQVGAVRGGGAFWEEQGEERGRFETQFS